MTAKEIREFLLIFPDDAIVYVDDRLGLHEIKKELCGSFYDENKNICPSLHTELIQVW